MFRLKSVFFGERSLTKVAGLFASRADADLAASDLLGGASLLAAQATATSTTAGPTSCAAATVRTSLDPCRSSHDD